MRARRIVLLLVAVVVASTGLNARASNEEKRAKIRKTAAQTLDELFKLQPASRELIAKSAGYGVFASTGTKLGVISTARGTGLAIETKTKQETFMKMLSGGAGLGVGVKNFRVIFVFLTAQAFSAFLDSGWSGSGQTDAAAKTKDGGGAYAGATQLSPGVWVYQITKKGVALDATFQGTKYSKDDDLNKKQ
jgi:lipid-binding SYLF domain-containing protein